MPKCFENDDFVPKGDFRHFVRLLNFSKKYCKSTHLTVQYSTSYCTLYSTEQYFILYSTVQYVKYMNILTFSKSAQFRLQSPSCQNDCYTLAGEEDLLLDLLRKLLWKYQITKICWNMLYWVFYYRSPQNSTLVKKLLTGGFLTFKEDFLFKLWKRKI